MNDILITSVQLSASSDSPMEAVILQMAKVDLEYKPQNAEGSLDSRACSSFTTSRRARKGNCFIRHDVSLRDG